MFFLDLVRAKVITKAVGQWSLPYTQVLYIYILVAKICQNLYFPVVNRR